jgi:excisionase family DNA binding protein
MTLSTDASIPAQLRKLHRFLSTHELAELLDIHPETLYRKTKEGFPHFRFGGRLKFDPLEVAKYLDARRSQ